MIETEAKLKKYSNYKGSGVTWLDEIPEHWELTRLGTCFDERRTKVTDKEYKPLSVTKNGTVPQLSFAAKTNDGDNRKLVKKGDFVINSRLDRKGSSGLAHQDGSVSLINIVLKPLKIYNNYCNYLLKSNGFVEEFYRMGHGIVEDLWTTRYDEMRAIKIGIPPLQEQTAIAEFLDDKTQKIDEAIAIKQQQITLLQERQQIVIQNAVTGKIVWSEKEQKMIPLAKSGVASKDSGIEWIGEIPEHWEVKKLFSLCHFIRGNSSFNKDELLREGEYIALQYGKTYKVNEVDKKYNFYVNDEFYNDKHVVNYGDTIVISTSETIEDLGHTVYYNRFDLGLLGGEQILIKPNKREIDNHYLYFSSKVFAKELRKYATGIKVFRFNINDLKTIYIAVPPFSEQKEIVDFIKDKNQKTATAISYKQQEIEKLQEYKSSLINSCVTGKIKVS